VSQYAAHRCEDKTTRQGKALDEWQIHDIRTTMTTWMADNGVAPHGLAAILNHSPGSTLGITAVFARFNAVL
jgi:hypothetical protein